MLEIASAEDIQEVMALERGPGFERLVGRWEQEEHLAEIAKASSRYFVLRDSRGIAGFAIVQRLGDPDGKAHLKRIAVRDPGRAQAKSCCAYSSTGTPQKPRPQLYRCLPPAAGAACALRSTSSIASAAASPVRS